MIHSSNRPRAHSHSRGWPSVSPDSGRLRPSWLPFIKSQEGVPPVTACTKPTADGCTDRRAPLITVRVIHATPGVSAIFFFIRLQRWSPAPAVSEAEGLCVDDFRATLQCCRLSLHWFIHQTFYCSATNQRQIFNSWQVVLFIHRDCSGKGCGNGGQMSVFSLTWWNAFSFKLFIPTWSSRLIEDTYLATSPWIHCIVGILTALWDPFDKRLISDLIPHGGHHKCQRDPLIPLTSAPHSLRQSRSCWETIDNRGILRHLVSSHCFIL